MDRVRTARTTQKNKSTVARKVGSRKPAIPSSYYWWPITRSKIKQAALKSAREVNPDKIILFGSFAYGKPTPDSDVDLLVIMESDESIHARSVRISKILSPRPFPVDLIVRTPAELQERLAMGDSFMEEITTKGKILYERISS